MTTATVALALAAGVPTLAQGAEDSATIDLIGVVEEFVRIEVDSEASFTIVDGSGELNDNHDGLFEVSYSANTDFDVTVDYSGELSFDGNTELGGDESITSELSVGRETLGSGDSITGLSSPADLISGEETFSVDLQLTNADENSLEAGEYSDSAEFTITAQ